MKDGKLKHKQGHCLGFTADLHLEKKIRGSEKMLQIQSFFLHFNKTFFYFFGRFSFFYKIVEINRLLFFFCSRKDFSIFLNRDIKIENSKINPR